MNELRSPVAIWDERCVTSWDKTCSGKKGFHFWCERDLARGISLPLLLLLPLLLPSLKRGRRLHLRPRLGPRLPSKVYLIIFFLFPSWAICDVKLTILLKIVGLAIRKLFFTLKKNLSGWSDFFIKTRLISNLEAGLSKRKLSNERTNERTKTVNFV